MRLIFFIITIVLSSRGWALELASPFTDHMVLQRDLPVPVWGWAEPGEKVTVSVGSQSKSAITDDSGHWRVDLSPLHLTAGARTLVVHGSETRDPIELTDVLVGEVWLCSGQSNMDFTVAKTEKYYFAGVNNEAEEVAAANYPEIRMFTGEWTRAYEPQSRIAGTWKVCTPENVREFSAIGYFFARDLYRSLNVPVGIVTVTYGASTAQAWIRREAIAADARLKPALDEFDAKVRRTSRQPKPSRSSGRSRWRKRKRRRSAVRGDPSRIPCRTSTTRP
jgi:sialate O-acetylesterase